MEVSYSDATVANRNPGFGERKWSLDEGQIANVRVVRAALGTGYDRVEGNRRASRNGLVSDLPPEIPYHYDSQLLHRCMSGRPTAGEVHP